MEKNPVADFEKARSEKRTTVVSAEQFAGILGTVRQPPFRDLLTVTWDTRRSPLLS